MNDLVIMKDQQAVTSSLQVADSFGKEHYHVLEAIESKISSPENSGQYQKMFSKGTYKDKSGKSNPMYYMNRDGFAFIVMGFTGHKADNFKLKYIEAFNAMQNTLKKVPVKKLDPALQAELAIANSKSRTANALYRIAMKTNSDSAQQVLLAKAAEAITGEMTIPIMKRKEYTATEVGKQVGKTPNKIGRICNELGLKAEQPGQNKYGRWSNSKSQHSDKEVPQWLYFEEGVKAIKAYLAKQTA